MKKLTVVVVDDEVSVLNALRRVLIDDLYDVILFNKPLEAVDYILKEGCDVVISDMRMPIMDGAELFSAITQTKNYIIKIALSGYADMNMVMQAVNVGKINRFITKPWDNTQLKLCVLDALETARLKRENEQLAAELKIKNETISEANKELERVVSQRTNQLKQALTKIKNDYSSILRVVYNISNICSFLDKGYCKNVGELAKEIAVRMGLEKHAIEDIYIAGLFCEIGIIGLPKELLNRPFSALNPEEKKIFLTHPKYAVEALTPAFQLQNASKIIVHQFERVNGKGLPDCLAGEKIPIGSRILSIAKDYWGYQLGKIQKEKLNYKKALQQLKLNQGIIYDQSILRELQKIVLNEEYHGNDHTSHNIEACNLKPDMVLIKPIYNSKKILILPEGHVFTESTIEKLRLLLNNSDEKFLVFAKLME